MLAVIDRLNRWVGWIVSFLVIGLIAVMVWGVILRYVFKSPLLWPDEMSLFLFGAYVILGGGYTLLHGDHVRVDVFQRRFPPRVKALIDLITFPLFFAFCGVLLWKGTKMAWTSVLTLEQSWSVWGPPVWPIKLTIPVGAFLLLIQGLVKFSRDFVVARGRAGSRREH